MGSGAPHCARRSAPLNAPTTPGTERAGFVSTYRYQKYRTMFRLGDATIDLDETPMGCFIEIEAPAAALASAAARLGAKESEFLVEDYRTLYREWLDARGLPPSDMIFEDPPRP